MLEQLQQTLFDLTFISSDLVVALGALIILILGMLFRKQRRLIQAAYVLILLVAIWLLQIAPEEQSLFSGVLFQNAASGILKLIIYVFSIWLVFFPGSGKRPFEFYFLVLSLILGSSIMLSANHLLIIYIGIELTSFSAYLITNFNFTKRSFESSIKYLLFGGVSSALALYGASLIYGVTGSLHLELMNLTPVDHTELLNVGIILFTGGILFKVSIIPFHIWVPTVYQEAPTDAVALMSVVPKIAGFALLHRFLLTAEMQDQNWLFLLMVLLGIGTLMIGSFAAIRQSNVKRMMAYGAIAHSGFLLACLLVPGSGGAVAFVWYSLIYALMNLGLFYWIALFEESGLSEVQDFAGLGQKESLLGGILVVIMIALIGLPPTAGFLAKFYLFTVLWEHYQNVGDGWLITYLLIAVFSIILSLFFYLRIPYYYFIRSADKQIVMRSTISQRFIATILAVALLLLFFWPDILNNISDSIKFNDW